jgi:hypothetical protein
VDGTNFEVMGSRFCSIERKVLLAFVVAAVALALIGAFSLAGLVVAFSLLMPSLLVQNVWGGGETSRCQRQARRDRRIER